MRKVIALLVTLVSSTANASDQAPNDVRELATKFKVTMMDCPEKIWTNYNWAGLKVVFAYPSRGLSWVWDASANSLAQVSNNLLPSSVSDSQYDFFSMSGQSTMSLNMEKSQARFELGVHEFFHQHGQKDWKRAEAGQWRGTVYPFAWQPRLYRRMIFDNLKTYARSNQNRDLEKARYWFDKWSIEHSYEPRSTTDGYEGSAYYAEEMAAAIAELGCSASDSQIKSHIVMKVQSKYGRSVSGEQYYFGVDVEGYEIGGLAAFLLRFQSGASLASWNGRVAEGQTPLQVLLEGVRAEQETAPAVLDTHFQAFAQRIDQERAPLLDPVIAQWQNRSFIRVAIPVDWLQSNFYPKFTAVSVQLKVGLYPLFTDHHFLSRKGLSEFMLKANAVVFGHNDQVCQDQYFYIPVKSDFVRFIDGIAEIETSSMLGRISGRLKTDDRGFKYLCAA